MSSSLPLGTGITLVRERPVLVRDASQRRGSHSVLPKVTQIQHFPEIPFPQIFFQGISAMVKMPSKVGKKVVGLIMRVPKAKKMEGVVTSSGLGKRDDHYDHQLPPIQHNCR